jgi:hypothetical protein
MDHSYPADAILTLHISWVPHPFRFWFVKGWGFSLVRAFFSEDLFSSFFFRVSLFPTPLFHVLRLTLNLPPPTSAGAASFAIFVKGAGFDFSTLFHSRIKPQDPLFTLFTLLALSIEGSFEGPTLSSSAPCESVLRTSPPHSNNHYVHTKTLLTCSNFHATM